MEMPSLNFYEAVMFAHFDILAPPAATVPHGWRISYARVLVAPLPGRAEMESEIAARRRQMPAWKRALPRYAAASPYWPALFKKERKAKIGNRIVYGRVVHRDLRNREGRERFWSVPGRTKFTVIAAAHREEVLRLAYNAEIVEVPSDEDEEAGGSEDSGSGSEIVD
jgi:hypothetical protein